MKQSSVKFSASITILFVVCEVTVSSIAVKQACIGEVLTLSCNVSRNGFIVWTGTAFDCPSSHDEITFINEGVNSSVTKSCNNSERGIIAEVVRVDGYISKAELNFTAISPLSNGEKVTIQCSHNDGLGEDLIATYTIQVSNCYNSSKDEIEEPTTDIPGNKLLEKNVQFAGKSSLLETNAERVLPIL